MKRLLFLTTLVLFGFTSFSQEKEENDFFQINNLALEVRTDFDYYNTKIDTLSGNTSGFSGRYLNFKISGNITENLFYAYRQRLNFKGLNSASDFFDKTDYMYLGWQATDNFAVSAGKQVVAMGGIEYDLAPIDVYYHTELWNAIVCYQLGVNAVFTTNDKKNTFTMQFINSPFSGGSLSGLYAYNLHWCANYKHFTPVCSVNMYEYSNGKFLNVIALGTWFHFGPVYGYIDYTNRASDKHTNFLFDDMTVDGRLGVYFLKDKMSVFAKAGYDANKAQDKTVAAEDVCDHLILPGTDITFYGGGVEYFPLKGRQDLRIHAFFAVNDTKCLTEIVDGELNFTEDKLTYQANIGITWRINFIKR